MKLALKILIPIFVVMTVIFVATLFYTIYSFENIFLENKALSLGDHAIRETKESLNDKDLQETVIKGETYKKIKLFTKAIEDPSVFRVKIWDKNLKIIYSDLKKLEGSDARKNEADFIKSAFNEEFPVRWKTENEDEVDTESGFGSVIEIIVPINDRAGETQYVLEMYSTTDAILQGIKDSINRIVYFWIVALILIYCIFYILIHFIVIRPIVKLRKNIDKVGKGDLSVETKNDSNDDMGFLYRKFDEMRLKLKIAFDQLGSSKNALESNISILQDQKKKLAEQLLELEKFQKLTVDRELKMIELKKEIEELKKRINNE